MPTPREKFQGLLKKLFQFDCAELDFGIYRIMNHKRGVIEKFVERDLLDCVTSELAAGALAQESALAQQLAEVTTQIKENFGEEAVDAEGNLAEQYHQTPRGKKYLELRGQAGKAKSSPELEAEIFNHLYTFFSRYYDEGDFMSLRRYSKRDKYAIPYNGEEVHLHWANSDQYYIKTGENFTDYSYKHGGWTVRFKLRNADVEQNNVKGAKRFFLPRVADVVLDTKARTLDVPFEFRPLATDEETRFGSKQVQERILDEASPKVVAAAKKIPDALAALLHEKRKDADGNPVSLLDHHLRVYARKNTSDFFIHKDLKGFLERELDFYLKNEVLNLDELEASGEARTESWFQILRAIKGIGHKIIAFVAQIENFEKRLFEKKKFVTEVHYCVTLDRVPEEMYPEIAENKVQVEEWKRLFHIHEIKGELATPGFKEPVKVEFLKAQQNLVVDTQFFSPNFNDRLLASINDLANATSGLLIQGENLQALTLLSSVLNSSVDTIYIDPPYNTKNNEFLYKDTYRHSSWIAMMESRLGVASSLLKLDGFLFCSIDENEVVNLIQLGERLFTERAGIIAIETNPKGRGQDKYLATSHEYLVFFAQDEDSQLIGIQKSEAQLSEYKYGKPGEKHRLHELRNTHRQFNKRTRENLWYPLYVNTATGKVSVDPKARWKEVYPYWPDGFEGCWTWGKDLARDDIDLLVAEQVKGRWVVFRKEFALKNGSAATFTPKTIWDGKEVRTDFGQEVLDNILGARLYQSPKPPGLIQLAVQLTTPRKGQVLDFFAGSGTTAHAVIDLNRTDKGTRKYVLVEMGEHFDQVLKTRIQKLIYSKDWKDGKPISRKGSSHAFKYLRLESYEDALDNITFQSADEQAMLQLEDYVLSYMLDFETKESETLLNVAKLDAPFDYKLRRHGEDQPAPVDLPETFNYLIGLHVESRRVLESKGTRYLVYRGRAEGRETVILWRTTRAWGKKEFEADRDFVAKQKLTEGAEDIFVNTDSFIPDARSLDPIFKRRMFNEE